MPLTIQRRRKTSFDSQHDKLFQTLVKSPWENFSKNLSSLWGEMFWKISPWSKFEVIALFVNTWTAEYKYHVLDCEILLFPIQIKLSWKEKTFSRFFLSFTESSPNFEHFGKKENPHSSCISQISERLRLGHAIHYLAPSQNILRQSTC